METSTYCRGSCRDPVLPRPPGPGGTTPVGPSGLVFVWWLRDGCCRRHTQHSASPRRPILNGCSMEFADAGKSQAWGVPSPVQRGTRAGAGRGCVRVRPRTLSIAPRGFQELHTVLPVHSWRRTPLAGFTLWRPGSAYGPPCHPVAAPLEGQELHKVPPLALPACKPSLLLIGSGVPTLLL